MKDDKSEGGIFEEEESGEDIFPEDIEKPGRLRVIGGGLEKPRTSVANWLLIIASFGIFFGGGTALGSGQKDWIFWMGLVGLGLLGVSIIAGVVSHLAYSGALLSGEDGKGGNIYSWDSVTISSFLLQVGCFGAGMFLTVIALLSFWADFSAITPAF